MKLASHYLLISLVALLASPAYAQKSLEIGIDRSNLTWESPEIQERAMQQITGLRVQWFRDNLSGHSPETNEAFVRELKLANQSHLKFLAVVAQMPADYDAGYKAPNAGPEFNKRCGWPAGSPELSKINLNKFTSRLQAQLDAVKKAGLTIDAFEIGNEDDWICFNGDVPDGHPATPDEFKNVVRGYANFLKAAATLIHSAQNFPNAQIITFGMAHTPDSFDTTYHHIQNPDRILEALRNFDGFNYLDNDSYHVDGIGSHAYTTVDQINNRARDIIEGDAHAVPNKPIWITEWGFNTHGFMHRSDVTRAQAIERFYAMLDQEKIPLGPNFFYALSDHGNRGWGLTDEKGNMLPEANAVTQRAQRH